jgi:uncharacterized protein (TIGR02147 family)
MILEHTHYVSYLKAELERRKQINPSYSLRAMAKNLGIAPSSFSEVLSGRKHFSVRSAAGVALRLRLKGRDFRYFCTLVNFEISKDPEIKSMLATQLRTLNTKSAQSFQATIDEFDLLSKWYHPAILELTHIESIKMSPTNIAEILKISVADASAALKLLVKMNFLIQTGDDQFAKTKKQFQFQSESKNDFLKNYHKAMLHRVAEDLDHFQHTERAIGSETVPLSVHDLPEARLILEECFQKIIRLSEQSKHKTDVFYLGIQLQKLSRSLNNASIH